MKRINFTKNGGINSKSQKAWNLKEKLNSIQLFCIWKLRASWKYLNANGTPS